MNAEGDNGSASMAHGMKEEDEKIEIVDNEEEVVKEEEVVIRIDVVAGAGKLPSAVSDRDTVQRWGRIELGLDNIKIDSKIWREKAADIQKVLQQAPFSRLHFGAMLDFIDSIPEATVDNPELHFMHLLMRSHFAIYKLQKRHRDVRDTLNRLAGRSQMNSTTHGSSLSGTNHSSSTTLIDSDLEEDLKHLPLPIDYDAHLTHVTCSDEWLSSFGVNKPRLGFLEDLPEAHQLFLKSFSQKLACYFRAAKKFEKTKRSSPKEDEENEKRKISDFQDSLQVLENALLTDRNDSSQTIQVKSTFVPAPSAPERDICRPFLLTLLQCLVASTGRFESPRVEQRMGSPPRTTLPTSSAIPRLATLPKCVVGKSTSSNGRSLYLLREDLIEIPAKEKIGERTNQSPQQQLADSKDKLIGPLAKQLKTYFNFKGVGVDAKATGIILTPAYVKILQLRLENVGKTDVDVRLLETPCMPLLHEDSFDQWIESSSHKQCWTKLGLYNKDTLPPRQEVPAGLVALYNVMISNSSDLFGSPAFDSHSDLGGVIDSGAFATVHVHKTEAEQVIKVARTGEFAALNREAKALRELAAKDSSSTRIVQYVDHCKLDLIVNELKFEMPALFVQPKGRSAQASLAFAKDGGEESVKNALHTMASDICDALSFIHSRKYTHNDVSPKNILWDDKNKYYFLIDFGLAAKADETLVGFQGTTKYDHIHIFSYRPDHPWKGWEWRTEYDYTALAFSVADLSCQEKPLWNPYPHNDLDEWANDRSTKAWNALELLGFEEEKWKARCFDRQ